MKLKKIHVFLLLIAVLMFCCSGFSVFEGMTDTSHSTGEIGRLDRWRKAANLEKHFEKKTETSFENKKQLSNLTEGQKTRLSNNVGNIKSVPKSKIPEGDEDLYILKSQIVPPVCPKCPDVKKCDTTKDCPACPAPQRCPEKPFECKMVPKWSDPRVSSHLPRPRLNSFDSFA